MQKNQTGNAPRLIFTDFHLVQFSDIYRFELSNHSFFMTESDIDGPQRRGILVLMKKNLGLKVARIEELNYKLQHYAIFGQTKGGIFKSIPMEVRRKTGLEWLPQSASAYMFVNPSFTTPITVMVFVLSCLLCMHAANNHHIETSCVHQYVFWADK